MAREITINLIGPENQYGLNRDRQIVGEILRAEGFQVHFLSANYYRPSGRLDLFRTVAVRAQRRLLHLPPHGQFLRRDINLFFERIAPYMFPMAHVQVLIPNQEYLIANKRAYLKQLDLVLCKSRCAVEIFSKEGSRTAYAGFTSLDRRRPGMGKKRREFLLNGGNRRGFADRVIAVWARHPEWPVLNVTGLLVPASLPANVRHLGKYISDDELIQQQNVHVFHVCVTAAEGFGHKHAEGMSCGAVVLATDAPPMNELVEADRGVMVAWDSSAALNLGTEYFFEEADFEHAVERCIRMTAGEIGDISARAREWYEGNDRRFREGLPGILRRLISDRR